MEKGLDMASRGILVGLALSMFMLGGCTGTLKVTKLTPSDVIGSGELEGIVFYPPALFFEQSRLTTRVDTKGNLIGWATEPTGSATFCHTVDVEKIVTRPDYLHPMLVHYVHGILEAYHFGVEITSEGFLKTVNTESSPDRGQTIANLASAAASGAKIAAGGAPPPAGTVPCNDGAVVTGYRRYNVNQLQ